MSISPKTPKKVGYHLQSAQNRVYIKNGQIVNHDSTFKADVYIEDDIIKFVGPASDITIPGGVRIIDAAGALIIPGGIDPHTHMQLKFGDDVTVDGFYHGTKAAVAGGTTTIIDFVLPDKGESLVDAYNRWRSWADPKVCCDYGLHVGLTWWSKSVSDEMKILCDELGVNSFKMFMACKGLFQLNDSDMLDALERIRALGGVAQVHAENGDIDAKNVGNLLAAGVTGPEGHELSREEEVEAEAVNRACILAHQTKVPLYVTRITCKSSAELIGRARRSGYCVFGETLASSVGRSMNGVRTQDQLCYNTSPPIRESAETPRQLMKSLAYDDLQTTASDNCTFIKGQKELGKVDFTKIPNGVNGVEDRMSIVWEKGVQAGLLDPCRFVAVTSTNAAKIFNLYPQKGHIAVGSDADVIIWNPNATRKISKDTHHHACDVNIFEGMVCHGVPEIVLVRGRICVENGVVRVAEGHGRFLNTPVRPPYVYDMLEEKEKANDEQQNTHDNIEEDERHHLNGDMKKLPLVALDIEIPYQEHISRSLIAGDVFRPAVGSDAGALSPTRRGRVEARHDMQESTFSISEQLDEHDHFHGDVKKLNFAALEIGIPHQGHLSRSLIAGNVPRPAAGSDAGTPSPTRRGRVDDRHDMQESTFSISEQLDEHDHFHCDVKKLNLEIGIPHQEHLSRSPDVGNVHRPAAGSDAGTPSPTRRGRVDGRHDMQESTFSISEEMDKTGNRSCIKVTNPPGGKSSGAW